jgi:ribosomal protein S18 acetylase RimI-like enzyme
MDILSRLHAYFHTIDPLNTVDVLPDTASEEVPCEPPETAADQREVIRIRILACTPESFRPAPPHPELEYVRLSQHSSLADIQEGLDTNGRGFDPTAAQATPDEAEAFQKGLITNFAFTARLHHQPVAAGMFTPPAHGVAEVVGITTLLAYRRRGFAAALTSEIVRVAFESGVEVAILRTDNAEAYRIYTRIGFAPAACLLTRPQAMDDNV